LLCGLLETDGEVKLGFNGDLYPTAGASVVMTTSGDMVKYQSGARARLGIGSANQILQVKSSLPSWETVDLADTVLTTQGDVLYENASGLARLGFGTTGDVLTTKGTGANPVWETPSGGATLTRHSVNVSTATSTTSLTYVDVPSMTATMTGSGAGNCIGFYSVTIESSNDFLFTCDWSTDGQIPPSPTYDGTGGKGLGFNFSSISLTLGSQTSKWMQRLAGAGTLTVCRNNTESESQWLEIS